MGMLKRILRETSSKLLHKLGAKPGSRGSMALANVDSLAPASGQPLIGPKSQLGNKKKHRRQNKHQSAALLMAAKNHLPPVQFHHVHGPNAVLSKNKCVARRTQSFCHALVFSNRIIMPNERVYIKVLEIAKGWSGTIRFGFTSVDPATLRCQMPKHACPDMTNAGHTWARALADEVVRRNSVIHFSYNQAGYIHYGINNQDCGVFYANVNTSQHLWFIVDIYGLTAAVELIDPRRMAPGSHGLANSEFDLSTGLDHELDYGDESPYGDRSTMFKSTGAMDQFGVGAARTTKRKRCRKQQANRHSQDALIYGQWPGSDLVPSMVALAGGAPPTQARPMLPNLSSIILPAAQQNIYTPMPSLSRPPPPVPAQSHPTDSHDYYQIMTQRRGQSASRIPSSSLDHPTYAPNRSALNSSQATSSADTGAQDEQEMLSNRLDSFQINDDPQQQQPHRQKMATKSTKSTIPVAAARRRQLQNNNPVQTNSKREVNPKRDIANMRTSSASSTSVAHTTNKPPTTKALTSSSAKHKARHSSKIHKTPSIRDNTTTTAGNNNNNPPPAKDCPICFERPINCVLYQCGHMCTCYECGVKQWRTQSRTCPICRTIIKDVIKTYMS